MEYQTGNSLGGNSKDGVHVMITLVGTLGGLILRRHGEGKIFLTDHCVSNCIDEKDN